MNQKNLYLDLNQAFNKLFYTLSAVSPEDYNKPAGRGTWTPGQLADHLALSARGLLHLVNGPAEKRKKIIDEKVPAIRGFMLDFSKKYQSPLNTVPGAGPFDQAMQTEELNQLQLGWLEAARSLDPADTCLLFPVPVLGLLTRQEAGYFNLYHYQRHLCQMGSQD